MHGTEPGARSESIHFEDLHEGVHFYPVISATFLVFLYDFSTTLLVIYPDYYTICNGVQYNFHTFVIK